MSDFLTDELKTLASAYSALNSQTNKLWSISAVLFLSVVAVKFDTESSTANLFGIPFSEAWFFVGAIIISTFLNFAYCSSHIQNYKTASIYLTYVNGLQNKESEFASSNGTKHTNLEFAHSLYTSNNNRYFPIKLVLENSNFFRSIISIRAISSIYERIKLYVDRIYSSIPALVGVVSAIKIMLLGYFVTGPILLVLVVIVSGPPWLAIQIVNGNWFKSQHQNQSSNDDSTS